MRFFFVWLLVAVSAGCLGGTGSAAVEQKKSSPHFSFNEDTFIEDAPFFEDAVADLSHVHPVKIFKHTRQQPGLKSYYSTIVIRTAVDVGSTEASRYEAADYTPIQLLLLFPKHYFW